MYTFPRLAFMNVKRRTSCRGCRAILTESTSELSAGCLQMLGNLRRAPKMQLFERPFQATKSSPANLFSERSKLKLDLARRLIKPELNVDENNFDETIFIPHSSKSQVKEISSVNKDKNVGKTTKATSKLNDVHVSHESSIIANMQKDKSITRDRWKILEARQSLKDRNIKGLFRSSTIKKSRIPTEREIISSSVEGTSMSSKFNIVPRRITILRRGIISVEETTATTISTTKVQSSMLQNTMVPREETSTLANMIETLDKNNIVTTIEPLKLDETSIEIIKSDKQERSNNDIQKETAVALDTTSITDAFIESMNSYTTEFAHDITLSPTVTTPSSIYSSTTESKKLYPVYIPDAKKYDLSENKNSTKFVSDASKSVFQPRYTKQQEPDKVAISMVTSMTVGPTSRYIRKKPGVFTPYDIIPKPFSTETTFTQMKHKEFRPRTATYRRHSEVPTSQLIIQQSTKADKETTADFITITSKPTKYNAHLVTAKNHSDSFEPLVSVKIDTSNNSMPLIFTESSNSNGSASNIFNPTKNTIFSKNTTTLLEQLRSTVAPLLNSLNEKTPIFSGAYSNVNIGNSAPRITPNGSPPRFSARYKGAELFVRKPSIDQVVIPSITTSSTTASTLIENSDLALPVHINSPGEPKFITFYQALESASIRNENLGVNVSQQQKLTGGVTKSDILLDRNEYTRMNTLPNIASTFDKLQGPIGSSIMGNRESSEASRTKVASNQRNSVYIGQDKFINYQIDNAPDINPKVVDVKINSVATFMNEGVASSMTSIPSFENLLNNQSGDGIVTTPSGFPWRDPLDQIFGITTNSPIQTASVTSNQLNETAENNIPIMARPINPLVEVFTPVISGVTSTNLENKPTTVSISSIITTTPIITTIPITTTTPIIITTPIPTTAATTTKPTTTTAVITTSTATTAATTTTTTSTTTPTTTTIGQTTSSTSTIPRLATTTSSLNVNTLSDVVLNSNTVPPSPTATISADNILNGLQMNTQENVFGTTFEDLTFLNSLLQNNNVKTTSKTLNDIEQMLANRILALAKPGPTRSPKAIKTISSNSILNAIKDFPSSESSSKPIIIDLLPSSSTLSPSISSTASTTKKYPEVRTTALIQSSTMPITRNKAPVVITAKSKTTIQPKTTTQAPIGFASLWRALFGSNRFEISTIASAKKNPKSVTPRSVQATQKSIEITPKPVQIIKSTTHTSHIMSAIRSHVTPRNVDISDIQMISTKSHADNIESTSASTLNSISTQQTLLNNPNPRLNDVPTSTYSSEDDAKFLVALLRAIQTETKTSTSTMTPKIIEDDEAFLRAILNNQASISTPIPSSTELNPAALLALLLKQQGIEPSTPAIKFREQLQLASLDLTTTRSMTTTTNRPAFSSSTQSAVSTRKTTTTPRQSLRSSERTRGYTWSPSSTYPPPLFGENSGSGLITATRAIGQFFGAAITGAARQLQSFLRNGTRSITG